MQLNVFSGALGLPSADIKSLQMMAYARFLKLKVNVVGRTLKPYIGNDLPELICEKGSITELEEYIEYLKFEAGSNASLNSDELTKLDKRYKVFEILFQETLKPALVNVMWLDPKNYAEKTRGTYAEISRFPLNFWVPNYLRKLAKDYMESVYPPEFRKKFFDVGLLEKAKGVLKLLSKELNDSKYFSGSTTPNEVDALIFGYLAFILKLQLPNLNNLQHFVVERRNLVAYVDRILSEYFPEQEEANKLNKDKAQVSKVDDLESVTWKSIVFVSLFAIASNLLYVIYVMQPGEEDDESSDEDE